MLACAKVGARSKGKGGENFKHSVLTTEPNTERISQPEIPTPDKTKGQTLNPLIHPGVPDHIVFC